MLPASGRLSCAAPMAPLSRRAGPKGRFSARPGRRASRRESASGDGDGAGDGSGSPSVVLGPPGEEPPAGQVLQRIHGVAVDPDLEVEVVAGAIARTTDGPDRVAGLDHIPDLNVQTREMRVHAREAIAVIDHDHVPVAAVLEAGGRDGPVRGRDDRLTVLPPISIPVCISPSRSPK